MLLRNRRCLGRHVRRRSCGLRVLACLLVELGLLLGRQRQFHILDGAAVARISVGRRSTDLEGWLARRRRTWRLSPLVSSLLVLQGLCVLLQIGGIEGCWSRLLVRSRRAKTGQPGQFPRKPKRALISNLRNYSTQFRKMMFSWGRNRVEGSEKRGKVRV